MTKRRSNQHKFSVRWKRKILVMILLSFCFGSLILMQSQYSQIKVLASLMSPQLSQKPKIAFLFIARNRLPLDVVWDAFFKGEKEHRFSIFVHSRPGFLLNKATTKSAYFYDRHLNDSIQGPSNRVQHGFSNPAPLRKPFLRRDNNNGAMKNSRFPSAKSSIDLPPFPLFQPPPKEDDSPSELQPADPDFYRIGFARMVRAYGVEFKEGPDGYGVFASRDVEPLRRARVIMEIPLELMLTISQKLPWMFEPDIIPIGHPIFDIINSTNPETDWDLRLACLLLFSFDCEKNFWQLYGDFLPSADECTSLLLASEEDLLELQDQNLAATMKEQQHRALEFWEKNWHSAAPLKIKRLARDPERFIWAVSIAQSRCINLQLRIGALIQDSNMLVPYADMLNHSFQPNCFFHWRFKDRMLEVMINAGQRIKKGEEMTINYLSGKTNNAFMERYGFSSPTNPWDVIQFSGNAQIHLDSFLSIFNISGLPEEFYYNSRLSNGEDAFIDGAVIAAARTLPTWSDGDTPPIPSIERKAARELHEECQQILAKFPTTSDEDQRILDSNPQASRTLETAIKYRLHRKLFIKKVIQSLEIYQERILF